MTDRSDDILAERARLLARPLVPPRAAEAVIEVIGFRLAGEHYALDADVVREVLPFTDFTPVPGVPAHVIGVTNLRGEILVVFDLRILFGLPGRGLTDRTRLIVCGAAAPEFGIVADATQEVSALPLSSLLAEATLLGAERQPCVRGVTRDAVIVLDGAALLRDRRLFVEGTATPSEGEA